MWMFQKPGTCHLKLFKERMVTVSRSTKRSDFKNCTLVDSWGWWVSVWAIRHTKSIKQAVWKSCIEGAIFESKPQNSGIWPGTPLVLIKRVIIVYYHYVVAVLCWVVHSLQCPSHIPHLSLIGNLWYELKMPSPCSNLKISSGFSH